MSNTTQTSRDFDKGYLAGLVDAEGYIVTSYDKRINRTYPGLRIYCTSKTIIDNASRVLDANSYARRDKGRLVGWIASVQGRKALAALRLIEPYITDQSKRARALTILRSFGSAASIEGKRVSSEFFSNCPPPIRSRAAQIKNTSSDLAYVQGPSQESQLIRPSESENALDRSIIDTGWLCGMVDGEGYVHIRYRRDRDSTYPRIRVFKSKSIIDKVAQLLGVNPYPKRENGKSLGWYVSVSHQKALKTLRLIGPCLFEPSKRCRAQKILDAFGEVGTIHSRLATEEFFRACPPPSRIRKAGRIISS